MKIIIRKNIWPVTFCHLYSTMFLLTRVAKNMNVCRILLLHSCNNVKIKTWNVLKIGRLKCRLNSQHFLHGPQQPGKSFELIWISSDLWGPQNEVLFTCVFSVHCFCVIGHGFQLITSCIAVLYYSAKQANQLCLHLFCAICNFKKETTVLNIFSLKLPIFPSWKYWQRLKVS